MKPYYVTLTISAVVMADNAMEAMAFAESEAREICGDGELTAEDAEEVTCLAQLVGGWCGECAPYNGDGTTLKDLLPETEPFKDTLMADMFAGAGQ